MAYIITYVLLVEGSVVFMGSIPLSSCLSLGMFDFVFCVCHASTAPIPAYVALQYLWAPPVLQRGSVLVWVWGGGARIKEGQGCLPSPSDCVTKRDIAIAVLIRMVSIELVVWSAKNPNNFAKGSTSKKIFRGTLQEQNIGLLDETKRINKYSLPVIC